MKKNFRKALSGICKFRFLIKPRLRELLMAVVIVSGAAAIFVIVSNHLIEQQAPHTFNAVAEIPANRVGLLLGTGKYLSNGEINLYYQYRIEAAARLYKAGKVKFILISGDNSSTDYDEPTMMKEDLVALGIPASHIYLDYAGFRTLDSVVRSKEIFGQKNITIISQPFHNERAIYIADKNGMEAVGFNAEDVAAQDGIKTQIREPVARAKMILDLIFGTEPKFLGDKIEIN